MQMKYLLQCSKLYRQIDHGTGLTGKPEEKEKGGTM